MKTVIFIYGTRPELIKLYPVIKECQNDRTIAMVFISTGQHGKMLDDVHTLFKIKPDYDFILLKTKTIGLNRILSVCIGILDVVLRKYNNPLVIVQGDTESALAGAMAAFNLGYKVYHVEAGLRSFNRCDPFPEEINRTLIDAISETCFTPSSMATKNIIDLKVRSILTGNTIIDTVNSIKLKPCKKSKTILVTCHRREHLSEKKYQLDEALNKLSMIDGIKIKYITHPNYLTKSIKNIKLIEPQPYDKFLQMINDCYFILTDSGGLQEEAAILGKPCLVMRNNTERQESIDMGISKLIGWKADTIYKECLSLIMNNTAYSSMLSKESKYLYGKPGAGKRIYEYIKKELA
jgi:UDP-N-acetylglucosamine 2-epimerase (non-hydrolysing)